MSTITEDAKVIAEELREKVIETGGNPNEANDTALALACAVLFSDGHLRPSESAFLRALLAGDAGEPIEPRAGYFYAKWGEIRETMPAFLVKAVEHDRATESHLADHIIDHIEAIALRASAVAEPVATESEVAPIREYCGFLRKRLAELRS